jgi:hypothetical protein
MSHRPEFLFCVLKIKNKKNKNSNDYASQRTNPADD